MGQYNRESSTNSQTNSQRPMGNQRKLSSLFSFSKCKKANFDEDRSADANNNIQINWTPDPKTKKVAFCSSVKVITYSEPQEEDYEASYLPDHELIPVMDRFSRIFIIRPSPTKKVLPWYDAECRLVNRRLRDSLRKCEEEGSTFDDIREFNKIKKKYKNLVALKKIDYYKKINSTGT